MNTVPRDAYQSNHDNSFYARERKSVYSAYPGIAMVEKWIDELPEKTGKSLDEWMSFIKKRGAG